MDPKAKGGPQAIEAADIIVNGKEKRSVLFVCLGNICRSPLAEGVFLNEAKQKGVLHQVWCACLVRRLTARISMVLLRLWHHAFFPPF